MNTLHRFLTWGAPTDTFDGRLFVLQMWVLTIFFALLVGFLVYAIAASIEEGRKTEAMREKYRPKP